MHNTIKTPMYQVRTHFDEIVCRGGFIKCWLYTNLVMPVGWKARIERATNV